MTVGIGTPGSTTAGGLIRNANSTCLNGRPLQADLEARLRRPLRLANDADCLALSEAVDGAAAGARVVFAVILGTGVGGGIVVDGRLLDRRQRPRRRVGPQPAALADRGRGARRAGLLVRPARLHRGLAERPGAGAGPSPDGTAAGTAAAPDAVQIAARAAAGDAACQASLQRHEERLGRALAAVINLLDPDAIVLGGGLSRLAGLAERVPELWPRHVFGARADGRQALRTRLVRSLHGDSSGVRGAAWLWRDALRTD